MGVALAPYIGVILLWTAGIAVVGLLGWGILRGIIWLLVTIFGERRYWYKLAQIGCQP